MGHDDSSGNVTNKGVHAAAAQNETAATPAKARLTADDALRLAIMLAVEVGDYERASALLEIAKRSASSEPR
jgi:hypothetical protein